MEHIENAHETTEERNLARKQLDTILTSRCFRRSERLRRLLSYLAQRSLFDNVSAIKEYTIAIDVFEKDKSFDPRRDPIVRVEARRLRLKLKEYYATEGADNSVTLDLQGGSYVLLFRRRVLSTAGSRSEGVEVGSCVLLQPFSALGELSVLDRFRDALMTELLDELSRIAGLRIVLWNLPDTVFGRAEDPTRGEIRSEADWILEGVLRAERGVVRVSVRLIRARYRELQWARSWDLPTDPALALLESLAGSVAHSLRLSLSGRAGG